MDDRQVDRADQAEDGGDPPLPASLLLGAGERDIAEIEEEQDEHRGHPPVPFPIGAPGRPAPERAGGEADGGEHRARHGDARAPATAASGWRQTSCIRLGDRDPGPARHAEPGGGDVDVDDPHALALEIARAARANRPQPSATDDQRRARPAQPGGEGSRDFEETGRIRVDVHVLGAVCSRSAVARRESPAACCSCERCAAPMRPTHARRLPPPQQNRLLGIGLRIGAATCFALHGGDDQARPRGRASATPELVFYRFAFGLPPLLVWIALDRQFRRLADAAAARPSLARRDRPRRPWSLAFSALAYLPLAEATTIGFAAPLFAVMLSALSSSEQVGRHRWSAVALGFVGVLIVMQPERRASAARSASASRSLAALRRRRR